MKHISFSKIPFEVSCKVRLPSKAPNPAERQSTNKNNLLNLDLRDLFVEYTKKNLALVIIEDNDSKKQKIYLRTKILGKDIDKNIIFEKGNLSNDKYYEKIIKDVSLELSNIVKSQNLIDIRTPSFLNTKFVTNKKYNLLDLNSRMKDIRSIDNIYVQEISNKYILVRIKYLGKIDKIIKEFENKGIFIKSIGEQWSLSLK